MVCKEGETPTVTYSFNNGDKRTYKSKYSPIEVEGREGLVTGTKNSSNSGYEIKVAILRGGNSTFGNYIIKDYKIEASPIGSPYPMYLSFTNCDGSTSSPGFADSYQILSTDGSKNCPLPRTNKCSLVIKHKGLIIFQDQGECPVSFNVQCGRCKDDEIECKSSKYPYFCCHSCEEMTNKVRSIKF